MTTATMRESVLPEAGFDPLKSEDRPFRLAMPSEGQLEERAVRLAEVSHLAKQPARGKLLERARKNHRLLAEVHHEIAAAVAANEPLTPDAEWLLDNFYVIDEVLREVETDLPHGYYAELPALASGPYADWPRTYSLAISLLLNTDSSLDENVLLRFVRAYQSVRPLTIGEVWSIPIMLRVGLLENLARLARQMRTIRAERAAARSFIEQAIRDPNVALVEKPTDGFLVGLLHALRDHAEMPADVDERVRRWLTRLGVSPDELLRREHQRQATNQISIGNSVTSLRLLAAIDWAHFFEEVSLVEELLRAEPTGTYTRQDFVTRDSYRAALERLARGSKLDELEVARRVIALAASHDGTHRGHLGYYLIGEGRDELAQQLGYRPTWRDAFRLALLRHPNKAYFGLLGLLSVGFLALILALVGPGSWPIGLAIALLALLPASEVAVHVVNFVFCRLLPPRVLPKFDFKEGIPEDCLTFVVIPTMLTRPGSAGPLLERLEMHYLANPDPNLRFALLTDFADAKAETMPSDQDCLQPALDGIRALNEKYASGGPDRFFLLHRKRLFNPSEGCWMGWERKRGKLQEFNHLLRGATNTTYTVCSADPTTLPRARFVLTLDQDTHLPRDSARVLVATLAHPLNHPRLGPSGRRVESGYGVLQPRISFLPQTGTRSLFARLFAFSAGIDPYASAVSDTYMDLFGRGTFTGKGLYDVDAFEATAGRAFPENHILSHDLIESNFARCGLVTDVELFDEFPSRYTAYSRREHRWARGDWQLLPWLGRKVPTPEGKIPNPLPLLERWKVVDNLRRTLVPPALILLLVLGWTVLPGSAYLWSLLGFLVLSCPFWLQIAGSVLNALSAGLRVEWAHARGNLANTAGQVMLSVFFLPSQAWSLLDAIARTLIRLKITRRRMLEWETAAATEARMRGGLLEFLRHMWVGPSIAIVLAGLLAWAAPGVLPAASGWLFAWIASPVVAWLVSRPMPAPQPSIDDDGRRALRRLACKTWSFFERYVGAEHHWLPPDNYQEEPVEVVAHRTSPTNMGLLLSSTLTAHDLGFISLFSLAARIEATLDTFAQLERYRGHFFNWYDTRTLQPLQPAYVSTVDSGNLLGCLLVVEQGLREKMHEPIVSPATTAGLRDRLELLIEELEKVKYPELLAETRAALRELESPPDDLIDWHERIDRLTVLANRWTERLDGEAEDFPVVGRRAVAFAHAVRHRQEELTTLFPWLAELATLRKAQPDDPRIRDLSKPMSLADLTGEPLQATAVAAQSDRATGPGSARAESQARYLVDRLWDLIDRVRHFADAMDFSFLYNPGRHLYVIGYQVTRETADQAHYDLLASEACLTSFLLVARGDAPRKHWFKLGRLFIRAADQPGLMSWGGSMFEYLMLRLFLPSPPGTLLHTAWHTAVARQIEYGRQTGIPWGISESAYNLTDAAGNYQYQAFGVPGLGLKRGLANDKVVAPYASVLAVSLAPREVLANLRRLASMGAEGEHGFYEAVDHTPDRLPSGQPYKIIRSYMAHHQGMSLLALANLLLDDITPHRLGRQPMVRAVELLLQEKVPLDAPVVEIHEEDQTSPPPAVGPSQAVSRRLTTPTTREPRIHLLSNGRYNVMITNSGAGFSCCGGLDVTRWRADGVTDSYGQFCFVRDIETGEFWSVGHQPVGKAADSYEILFSVDKVEMRRRDGDIETYTEIAVSTEHDAEVRRITIINHGNRPRQIELTSYAEVVLAHHRTDVAHPAFHRLFLETQWHPARRVLFCRRRPRSAEEKPIWAAHILAVDNHLIGEVEAETDRARFIGRRGTLAAPRALSSEKSELSGTVGPVLDPIFSLRCRLQVSGGSRAVVAFTTAMGATQEDTEALAEQYHMLPAVARAFELAWAHSRVELKDFNLTIREAQLFQRLAGHVLFPPPGLRAQPTVLAANRQGQNGLWRHGISGDLPIVLVRAREGRESLELVRQLLSAHSYWHAKGFLVDLVLLNEAPTSYYDDVSRDLTALVRASGSHERLDRPGGVFVRKADQFTPNDLILLQAWARIVLSPEGGPLEDQMSLSGRSFHLPPLFEPSQPPRGRSTATPPEVGELQFFNGIGGFSPDGRLYVVGPTTPPAPWCNVIANPHFGFLISDSGSGYTWAGNSQLNRLTPWSNDPVCDPPGEVVYLRDEQTGEVWSPTPLPRAGGPTIVRHGAGFTTFTQRRVLGASDETSQTVEQELTLFVPPDAPVKVFRLRLSNPDKQPLKLSATFYVEWVLGTNLEQTGLHVQTMRDPETGAILASNPTNTGFAPAVAFAASSLAPSTVTGDRAEFLGRGGSLRAPAGLERKELSGRVGPGLSPCAALQVPLEVPPEQTVCVIFLLGQAADNAGARLLIECFRHLERVEAAFKAAQQKWDDLLGTVQVRTPDSALDMLLNRWLLYQTVSCRLWGRTGFYQSGGAYGFRDQLQDVMALVHAAPSLTREHLLKAAAKQFREGDVLHWWHPPIGQGVRTRISDDFLWLVLVSCHYIETTGDLGVLDEPVPFVEAAPLNEHQEEMYGQPRISTELGTLYEHCVRALDNGWKRGPHGLPLIGSGDWNDGMNRIGVGGQGESVWLAWFQIICLERFAELALRRFDGERARLCHERAALLRRAIEKQAWDGEWYRRAYFDDGTPVGSSVNDECRIDSLPQSWAVLAGSANPERARQAVAAAVRQLVRRDDRLILLFTPPFDRGPLQPGYIKGYVPGTRENGGQYTHAAIWLVQAVARLGDGEEAHALFDLINPIRHADEPGKMERYHVEPYVVAADVYGEPPHVGRGGWTWYTGSAGWLYQVGLGELLGFVRQGDRLLIKPCVPEAWDQFEISFRCGASRYEIIVERGERPGIELDDAALEGPEIPLADDGQVHRIVVRLAGRGGNQEAGQVS